MDPFALETYDYDLPSELIAQAPAEPRDHSRLLVVDKRAGTWSHHVFKDIPRFLREGDLLVANNTRVIRARLSGARPTGGKVEFLLLKEVEPLVWRGMFHSSAKHKPGLQFQVARDDGEYLLGELIAGSRESSDGSVVARFDRDPLEFGAGEVPLPPYISSQNLNDEKFYQTVYARSEDRHLSSPAAPTAGFHFTPELLKKIKANGVRWEEVTLQVGISTFRPIKTPDIRDHKMHTEYFEILPAVAERVEEAKQKHLRVIAVGTTSVRVLETAFDAKSRRVKAGPQETSIYFHPGGVVKFQCTDALITNFHLPRSSLFALVCAFGGTELMRAVYGAAVKEKYRFFSYGDAMLII